VLRLPRERLDTTQLGSRFGVAALLCAASLGCGSANVRTEARAVQAGGPTSRIEERSLSDRPPLSVIEREGDPEIAIAFASLASAAPELHAAFGEVLSQRLSRAGFQTQLVAHGLGFELMLLAETPERARLATQALLQALSQPPSAAELGNSPAPALGQADRTPSSAVSECSAELSNRRHFTDTAELERDRIATFARDRAAWAVVGDADAAAAVSAALAAGPDWPELGHVRSHLSGHPTTELLRGQHASLSVAFTLADPNRALGAAASLGDAKSALSVRLSALGAGLRLRRVVATAHPVGACLRIDSDLDASPGPDARRLGFAVHLIEEEATLSLARATDENRLEATALSAADPRLAARAAAYGALIEPASKLATSRLVALTTPDEPPLAPSIEAAIEQARADVPVLDARVRVEAGQPGVWALVTTPCGATPERADSAGHAAVLMSATAAAATRNVRLEPWVGAEGLGVLGFAERAPGETDAEAGARLGDALGQALLAPPTALEVATARGDLLKAAGAEPHPLLDALFESLAPGHVGALAPRGLATSLQSASREAVLARQREFLRSPHRLAILSPTNAGDANFVTRSLARWLKTPDAPRPSPCEVEVGAPSRGELSLTPGADAPEGSYLAFRIPAKTGIEAGVLAELLNLPGGALARAVAEPDLVGAARALVFGTSSARALVVQVSAFEGREQEALSRVQKLFERLASGGVLVPAEVEAALARQRAARRLAALDPRYRLVQLLDPSPAAPIDAGALRRLAASLRPEAAVIARSVARPASPSGKTPSSR
jgi:hypothetical protein